MRKLEIGTENYTQVYAMDERGAGNANHIYEVLSLPVEEGQKAVLGRVEFQNGPIKENGLNGVMNEDLIAIVIDRLDGFQSGPYAHPKNAEAKQHLELALYALNSRTAERKSRGVEGTSTI